MQNNWWGRPLLPKIFDQIDLVRAKLPIFHLFSLVIVKSILAIVIGCSTAADHEMSDLKPTQQQRAVLNTLHASNYHLKVTRTHLWWQFYDGVLKRCLHAHSCRYGQGGVTNDCHVLRRERSIVLGGTIVVPYQNTAVMPYSSCQQILISFQRRFSCEKNSLLTGWINSKSSNYIDGIFMQLVSDGATAQLKRDWFALRCVIT